MNADHRLRHRTTVDVFDTERIQTLQCWRHRLDDQDRREVRVDNGSVGDGLRRVVFRLLDLPRALALHR